MKYFVLHNLIKIEKLCFFQEYSVLKIPFSIQLISIIDNYLHIRQNISIVIQ